MAGNRLPDHDKSLREFRAKVNACTEKAVCGRSYVLIEKLARWLRSTVHPDKTTPQVGRLLMAAYHDSHAPPLSTEKVADRDSSCLLIFSILLLLGRGNIIDEFQRRDILDKHLPISLLHLQRRLDAADIPNAKQLAADFDEKQWQFCPAKFDLHSSQEYDEHRILPICRKKKINEKGGTAQLWQIEVKDEFVGQALKDAVTPSRYNCGSSGTEPDWRYQFALKSFEHGSMGLYKNERSAFDRLRDNNGMIRYLADYAHAEDAHSDGGDPETRKQPLPPKNPEEHRIRSSFNLLLEFGEFDLDEYFAQELPPVLQDEIDLFWGNLFDVADALDGIHNLKLVAHGSVKELCGWHADIKPDNILRVQGNFKLADPGFAKFKQKGEPDPEEFLLGGTETYGAPERYSRRGTMSAVSQAIDIWSLGCVFSIAATWVVFGYAGIQQYRKVREKGIKQILSEPKRQQHAQHSTSVSAGDYFHDGNQVLESVTNWHKVLRSAIRKTDTVTNSLLDLVDQKMLLGSDHRHDRIKAKELCSELKQVTSRSKHGRRFEMPSSIMETLLEADKDATSSISVGIGSNPGQPPDVPDDRKARKSRLLALPMLKTAHRSEGLKSVLDSHHAQPETSRMGGHPVTGPQARLSPADHDAGFSTVLPIRPHLQSPTTILKAPTEHAISPITSSQMVLSSYATQKPARRPKTHTTQNVFQARDEIDKRDKHNYLRRERKDELLARHFGNRDLKFLVDNGESMKEHWAQTKHLLRTLVLKAAGQDDNGLDLCFTLGQEKLENKKSSSKDWDRVMEKAAPMKEARTDMKRRLAEILDGYLEQVRGEKKYHRGKPLRGLTIIVLTDGIWAGMGNNQHAVNDKIVSFMHQLKVVVGDLIDRLVSIEFVQLGDDQEATYRLRQLDTGMKWKGIPDIIDTEPAHGDVNKMLLGSFVQEYDDEDEEPELNDPETPLRQTESPAEMSSVNGPSRSLRRDPTRLSISPPDPPVFISRPTT